MILSIKKTYEIFATAVVTFGLIVQFFIIKDRVDIDGMSWFASFKMSLSYMTIWTNILVCVTLWNLALDKKNFLTTHSSLSAIVVYILIVGVVYHFALSHLWHPTGKIWVTDKIFHYISPALFTIYWMLFEPKEKMSYNQSIKWLWYPAIYATLTLVNGLITNEYAYPIFNLKTMPVFDVVRNTFLTLATYSVFGLIIIGGNNLRTKKDNILK